MSNTQKLSKTQLAALDLIIAYMEENGQQSTIEALKDECISQICNLPVMDTPISHLVVSTGLPSATPKSISTQPGLESIDLKKLSLQDLLSYREKFK